MAYVIKIGDQAVSLDDQTSPLIEVDWKNAAKYDFGQLTEIERKNIFLIGLPLEKSNRLLNWFRFKFGFPLVKDKIRNFSQIEIFRIKYKLRIKPSDTIIQKIIEQKDHYKFILVDPGRLSPYSLSLIKDFIFTLNDSPQKVFVVDIINQPKFEFEIKEGIRVK
ncbi:MAG: hypothetical protein ACXWDO_03810 [Bacteroidia bacterium]